MVTTRLRSRLSRGTEPLGLAEPLTPKGNSPGIDDSGEHDPEHERVTKKRRVARASNASGSTDSTMGLNIKRKFNKRYLMATFFQTLPLDIVFEIFSLLHPLDLLHLSRLNKALRGMLMSRSFAVIWRTARSILDPGVPECPPDQSEPQWAKLLFEMSCTLCNTTRIRIVDWSLRLRACQPCIKANIISHNRALAFYSHIDNIKEILGIIPYTAFGGLWGWHTEVPNKRRLYYHKSILKMIESYEELQFQIDARIEGAEERLVAFKLARLVEVSRIAKNVQPIYAWERNLTHEKTISRDALVRSRRESLSEKLLLLGHDRNDVWRAVLSVYNPGPLTDKSWERARSKMEAVVEQFKIRRLEYERERYIARRHSDFFEHYQAFLDIPEYQPPFPGFAPCSFDILERSPTIRELVEAEGNLPFVDAMVEHLPGVLESWRREQKEDMLASIPTDRLSALIANKGSGTSFEVLNLAKSVFIGCCESEAQGEFGGGKPVFFEASLTGHSCYNRRSAFEYYSEPQDYFMWCEGSCLRFLASASDNVDAVCQAIKLDPNAVTVTTLDELNARFKCVDCPEPEPKIRGWRFAIMHVHPDGRRPRFQRVPRLLEEFTRVVELAHYSFDIACKICGEPSSLCPLIGHLADHHSELPTQFYG